MAAARRLSLSLTKTGLQRLCGTPPSPARPPPHLARCYRANKGRVLLYFLLTRGRSVCGADSGGLPPWRAQELLREGCSLPGRADREIGR